MAACSCIVKIGIIGGSGLDDPDILANKEEKTVTTAFGNPSDVLISGKIGGVDCVLLARHGRTHSVMPSNVNYRANIWALKEAGCTHVLASTACGSLREELKPGSLVIPHDFIDRTTKRMQTFSDGQPGSQPGVCHLPMFPSFNERVRTVLIESAKEINIPVHEKAVIVAIEGPRYSSRAESLMYRDWGADLINMTTCPEVVLAKEAGLLYGAVAMATDYDSWHEGKEAVCVADVVGTFANNVSKVKEIIINTVKKIQTLDWTEDIQAAQDLPKNNNQALK